MRRHVDGSQGDSLNLNGSFVPRSSHKFIIRINTLTAEDRSFCVPSSKQGMKVGNK
jgi:hypothetical protein